MIGVDICVESDVGVGVGTTAHTGANVAWVGAPAVAELDVYVFAVVVEIGRASCRERVF